MNGLKERNDNFGHMNGDHAIIAIAHIIKNAFEPQGVSYRTGGDEICVILSKAALDGNDVITESLQKIGKDMKSASQNLDLELSVAVGYSRTAKLQGKSIYQVYREADRRMYQHKQRMKEAAEKAQPNPSKNYIRY